MKKNFLEKVLKHGFFLGLILSTFFALSQQRKTNTDKEDNWIKDGTVENVSAYHKMRICNGKNTGFIRFVNTNSFKVKVSWKEFFVTNVRSQETEGFKGLKEITIAPGETFAMDCNDSRVKEMIVLAYEADPTKRVDMISFNIKNMVVTRSL